MEISTVAVPTREYTRQFFWIETFRDREVFMQKEVMFQKKEHKQGEGRSTVNAEVIFQHVTGFVYV